MKFKRCVICGMQTIRTGRQKLPPMCESHRTQYFRYNGMDRDEFQDIARMTYYRSRILFAVAEGFEGLEPISPDLGRDKTQTRSPLRGS